MLCFNLWALVAAQLAVLVCITNAQNMFLNPDFESTDYSGNWICRGGCGITASTNSHSGQYSAYITNRSRGWKNLAQDVNLIANAVYRVTFWVNLESNANGRKYQRVWTRMECYDAQGVKHKRNLGQTPHIVPGVWRRIGGVIRIPEGCTKCQVFIKPDETVNYWVDDASAEHVPDDEDWRTNANQQIETLRKKVIRFNVTATTDFNHNYELTQTRMEFPVGTAVGASKIVHPSYKNYQDAVYDNFNWAVLGNILKWKWMEVHQGTINYDSSWIAMNALRAHGIKCRCHCTFWARERNVQDWVKVLSGDDLVAAIDTRIEGVIGNTTGRCEQWDVNNENLHGDFFERQTGQLNITQHMFRQIHAKDPHPELYLNDFGLSNMAMAMKEVALQYQELQVPLHGIGIQSHLDSFIDLHVLKANLDIVAEAGLPIMITEFSLNDANETRKAINLDRILTTMFAHPSVKGIILWGFWDGDIWQPDAVLYTGPNVTPNAAGVAYENLFHNEWRTNDNWAFSGSNTYEINAFKGDYTLTVKRDGAVLKTVDFTLGDEALDLDIVL